MLKKLALITLCLSVSAPASAKVMVNGIICGSIAYWATKIVCYGAVSATAAAGTAAVVASAGAVGPAVALATANLALPGAGLAAGASGALGAAIGTSAAVTNAAAMATVSTAATAGGVAGVVTTIESASTTMGYIFTMIPWLP